MIERELKEVAVGDRVKHCVTKQWGDVLYVQPCRDGTIEFHVRRDPATGTGWEGDAQWPSRAVEEIEKRDVNGEC